MSRSFPRLLREYFRLHAIWTASPAKRKSALFRWRAGAYESRVSKRYAASIPVACSIGESPQFPHDFNGIHIATRAVIGDRVTIHQQVTIGNDAAENAPIIGNDVYIGAGAKIIGRCRIGDGARIGANVVLVNVEVPPGAIIVDRGAFDLAHDRPVYPDYKLASTDP